MSPLLRYGVRHVRFGSVTETIARQRLASRAWFIVSSELIGISFVTVLLLTKIEGGTPADREPYQPLRWEPKR